MKTRILILYWIARLFGLPLAFSGRFHDSTTTRRGPGRVIFTTDDLGVAVESWNKQKAHSHGEGAHHLTLEIFIDGALAKGRKSRVPKAIPGEAQGRSTDASPAAAPAPHGRGGGKHRAHDTGGAAGLAGQPAGERNAGKETHHTHTGLPF